MFYVNAEYKVKFMCHYIVDKNTQWFNDSYFKRGGGREEREVHRFSS
jgi:hypothetical protein